MSDMTTTVSKKIPGVPESISRDDYIKLVASTGLDPKYIKSIQFNADFIAAVIFAVDASGNKIIGDDGWEKHSIIIPVVDEEDGK